MVANFDLFSLRWIAYALLFGVALMSPLPSMQMHSATTAPTLRDAVSVTLYTPPPPKAVVPQKPQKPKPVAKPKPKPVSKPKPKPKPIEPAKTPPKPIEQVVEKPQEREPQKQEVSEVEKVNVVESEPKAPVRAVQDDAIAQYQAHIRETIYMRKFYPAKARRMKHQGDVTVRFIINAEGAVQRYEILKGSGFSTLDTATNRLFSNLGNFDRPPSTMKTPYEFTITLNYRLK